MQSVLGARLGLGVWPAEHADQVAVDGDSPRGRLGGCPSGVLR